ncbi:hypothetical protein F4W70_03480 [Pseudomonas cannabina]|nr:hypothetical protein F4W70_03480 [Pseudomonas cannabina]
MCFVGADLSAKAMVGAISFLRMYHPLRGQVRSHTSEASPGLLLRPLGRSPLCGHLGTYA